MGSLLDCDFTIVKEPAICSRAMCCHRKSWACFGWLKITFTSRRFLVFFFLIVLMDCFHKTIWCSALWIQQLGPQIQRWHQHWGKCCVLSRIFSRRSCVYLSSRLVVCAQWSDLLLPCRDRNYICFSLVSVPLEYSVCSGVTLATCCPAVPQYQGWNCPVEDLCWPQWTVCVLTCVFSQVLPLYLIQIDLIPLTYILWRQGWMSPQLLHW